MKRKTRLACTEMYICEERGWPMYVTLTPQSQEWTSSSRHCPAPAVGCWPGSCRSSLVCIGSILACTPPPLSRLHWFLIFAFVNHTHCWPQMSTFTDEHFVHCTFYWMGTPQFSYPSNCEGTRSSQYLASRSNWKINVNIYIQVTVCTSASMSVMVDILKENDRFISSCFQRRDTTHSHLSSEKECLFLHLYQHFIFLDILVRLLWYIIVILIYISLIVNNRNLFYTHLNTPPHTHTFPPLWCHRCMHTCMHAYVL